MTFLLSISLLISLAGCRDSQPRTYPVQGLVRFADGKVLRGGSIEFESSETDPPLLARGIIGPDGSFRLGTFELDDGAIAGKHRVVVLSNYQIGTGAERPGKIPQQVLHPKYRGFKTSGIVQQIKPDKNTLLIEVEYAPADSDSDSGESESR